MEDQAQRVNNIVRSFRLQTTSFDKKSFVTYLRGMSLSSFRVPALPRLLSTDGDTPQVT